MIKKINQNTQKIFGFIFLIVTLIMVGNLVYASGEVEKRNENNYFSKTNAPVFYGATKITIEKGSIETFNLKDPRFRIFAKDFEDGDVTQNITYEGSVDVNTVGTYQIMYHVNDNDGNVTNTVVPVIVKEKESEKGIITVERTIYTTPSTWNLDRAGIKKSTYEDRQILGVYLKPGQNINVRNISTENITIDIMNNDSSMEASFQLNTDGNFITIGLDENGYHGIPVLRTPVLTKENNDLSKTYKIEIEFESDIDRLQYYHYKDNETVFRSDWSNSGHTYGVIENETITVIVPYMDIDKLTNYYPSGFTSLDEFLDYYKNAIDKMDEYIGLDLNPEKITDQNVKTKYLIKADVHTIGNFDNYEDHIGIHSYSVSSFFEKSSDNLHALARTYQGYLEKGTMDLSYPILGHYIVQDNNMNSILGNLEEVEEKYNIERQNETSFNNFSDDTKLYMMVNLLDSFEGRTTYSKIYSWYREQLSFGNSMTNGDAYVKAMADICSINILPYMEEWKVSVSSEVKEELYQNHYQFLNITKDMVKEETLSKILTDEQMKLQYSLVGNSVFHKYNAVGDITLTINISNISKLNGTYIQIKDGNNVIKEVEITSSELVISDLPVGTYYVEMPVVIGYRNENHYIKVKEGINSNVTYTYKEEVIIPSNSIYINIYGYIVDRVALVLDFNKNYRNVTIRYPEKALMSSNEYIKIYDTKGNIIAEEKTVNGYFEFNKGVHDVELYPGYVIEIKYPKKHEKVRFYDSVTNVLIPEYDMVDDIVFYTVTEDGLKKEDIYHTTLSYELLRNYYINVLDTYNEIVTEDILNNKNIEKEEKAKVVMMYEKMTTEDQKPYRYLVYRINRGGVPIFTYLGKEEYDVTESIDLYSLVSVIDNEDGYIKPIIIDKIDLSIPGEYSITYKATDSDGNVTSYTARIKINEVLKEEKEVKQIITNKYQRPVPEINNQEYNDNQVSLTIDDIENNSNNENLSIYEKEKKVQVKSAIIGAIICICFIICITIYDHWKNKIKK